MDINRMKKMVKNLYKIYSSIDHTWADNKENDFTNTYSYKIKEGGLSFGARAVITLKKVDANGTYYNGSQVVATSEGTGEDEKITVSDYTYLLLIRALADTALAEHTDTTEFSGDVDTIYTYEYKTDYNIGDIVKVINEYGIEAEARIIEIMESDDNEDGYTVEPTFEYLN